MLAIGALSGISGVLFTAAQEILFAFAATALFGAVLTHYLTPEKFIAASVGERVYDAGTATVGAELISELGLQDSSIYVPSASTDRASSVPVRLFVPQHRNYDLPEAAALESLFVVTDDDRSRGVSLTPAGGGLVREFESTLTDDLATEPDELAAQLTSALVENFELAASATVEYDADNRRVTVGIQESAYGPVTRFDHPIASFVATGLAKQLDAPVRVETTAADGDQADYLITCRWGEAVRTPGDGDEAPIEAA